jgi:hypothetical protein
MEPLSACSVVSVKFCKMVAGDAGLAGVEPHMAQAPARPGRRQAMAHRHGAEHEHSLSNLHTRLDKSEAK